MRDFRPFILSFLKTANITRTSHRERILSLTTLFCLCPRYCFDELEEAALTCKIHLALPSYEYIGEGDDDWHFVM
jgi:hypothetical protein